MIYPLPVRDGVEGTVGDSEDARLDFDIDLLEELQAIHPTSDVMQLLEMPLESAEDVDFVDQVPSLQLMVDQCRDVYNEGLAITRCDTKSRIECVREILSLRAKFYAMTPKERAALRVDRHGVKSNRVFSGPHSV